MITVSSSVAGRGKKDKGKGSPILDTSVGSGADPDLRQSARSWQVINPAVGCHYFPLDLRLPYQPKNVTVLWPVGLPEYDQFYSTKCQTRISLYCLVTEAHVCEQLAHSRYMKVERPGLEHATSRSPVQRTNLYTTMQHRRRRCYAAFTPAQHVARQQVACCSAT